MQVLGPNTARMGDTSGPVIRAGKKNTPPSTVLRSPENSDVFSFLTTLPGIDLSHPIDVYWNTRRKLYSIRQGRVLGHSCTVVLVDAEFIVSEAGRQRVLLERRKNVHAVVRGRIPQSSLSLLLAWQDAVLEGVRVTYNPFINETFINWSGTPVYGAEEVLLAVNEYNKPETYATKEQDHAHD